MRLTTFIFIAVVMASCTADSSDANPAELEAAARAGREAGAFAASLPPNTMAQQEAILDIRAKETKIREAGFPSCADTFAVEAAKMLF